MKVIVRNFKDQQTIIVEGGGGKPHDQEGIIRMKNSLFTATCVVKMGTTQMIAGINAPGAAGLIILIKIVGFDRNKRPIFLKVMRLQISYFILVSTLKRQVI